MPNLCGVQCTRRCAALVCAAGAMRLVSRLYGGVPVVARAHWRAPRPQSDASCEDYAGCAFDIRCPLGHDSDVECGAQAGASLGVVGVVSLCCLAALCRTQPPSRCRCRPTPCAEMKAFRHGHHEA